MLNGYTQSDFLPFFPKKSDVAAGTAGCRHLEQRGHANAAYRKSQVSVYLATGGFLNRVYFNGSTSRPGGIIFPNLANRPSKVVRRNRIIYQSSIRLSAHSPDMKANLQDGEPPIAY